MEGKVAKWWLPDEAAFVEELPHTAAGKVEKALREMFKDRGGAAPADGDLSGPFRSAQAGPPGRPR